MTIQDICSKIANDLSIQNAQVVATVALMTEGCTVPFIARYRKERTGMLDEVKIREVFSLHEYYKTLAERKEVVLKTIKEQGKLSSDLEARIKSCFVKSELEDLYLPFKPKKRTKGQIAVERGLLPLAQKILTNQSSLTNLTDLFENEVNTHPDLKSAHDVEHGIVDYLSEELSENADIRKTLRNWLFEHAVMSATYIGNKPEEKSKYSDYYNYKEQVKNIPPHRFMALKRGEKEDILRLDLVYEEEPILNLIEDHAIELQATQDVRFFLTKCSKEAFKRHLSTTLETEIRLEKKNLAEDEAIKVFSKNLRNLLLLPPIPGRAILGIDPGLRTGSKAVVLDETGKLLEYITIYPHLNENLDSEKNGEVFKRLNALREKYNISLIAIGNGTGSRELEEFIEAQLKQNKLDKQISISMVNESGASVYSASDLAREEFPDLDISYRGAVSIGRRLQDPLAELVKIDPKSIGVGQYQHDINPTKLKKQLGDVVESCVNYVGVNINTASASLLSYVAGISSNLAKNIILYREAHGLIKDREELLQVPGFGPRTYEQSAGFIKVKESKNPLDNTGVHPESYRIVEKIAQHFSCPLNDLLGNKELLSKMTLTEFTEENFGIATVQDIVKELLKPGRDPREEGTKRHYRKDIRSFESLTVGEVLEGTVSNVTNFGAFVDIGVHQDGLVHISEITNEFISDISKSLQVGQQVKVKVVELDQGRKRISLSMKALQEGTQSRQPQERPQQGRSEYNSSNRPQTNFRNTKPTHSSDRRPQQRSSSHEQKPAPSVNDLLSKFRSHNA